MGKHTGFVEFDRMSAHLRPVSERIKDFNEFVIPLPKDELRNQGARCMDCGTPFCHTSFGCPVYNLIPEWNDLVYRNLWKEAYHRLEKTNNFPEFTGRICPAPCETACTLAINDSPVTIKEIELAIIEHAFERGWVVPRKPNAESGKSVAIVGSGPAGLAAAQQLRRVGHQVTVYEKSPKAGGLLRYGIPDFKLQKNVIDRRLEQMIEEGVKFETNVTIGDDLSSPYLVKSFDVVLLAIGSESPRDLKVRGRKQPGVYFAMDYLKNSNLYQDGLINNQDLIDAKNKKVLVLGGGDTGSDCVGTANRQGASEVHQYEILNRPQEWDKSWNPHWPDWPNILRTSSSHAEGCIRQWNVLTKEFKKGSKHALKGIFSRVSWQDRANGSAMEMKENPDSSFQEEFDLVFLAMGFVHPSQQGIIDSIGIKTTTKKNIQIGSNFRTSVDNVFAAGDAVLGASLVVRAIYQGRQAAESIDKYLKE